jgi:hypothetical protein
MVGVDVLFGVRLAVVNVIDVVTVDHGLVSVTGQVFVVVNVMMWRFGILASAHGEPPASMLVGTDLTINDSHYAFRGMGPSTSVVSGPISGPETTLDLLPRFPA